MYFPSVFWFWLRKSHNFKAFPHKYWLLQPSTDTFQTGSKIPIFKNKHLLKTQTGTEQMLQMIAFDRLYYTNRVSDHVGKCKLWARQTQAH